MSIDIVRNWYQSSYQIYKSKAQRKYPNEEMIRFLGRNLFSIPMNERSNIRILDLGCGNGANTQVLCKEGFDVYGLDISSEAVDLCRMNLDKWGLKANLRVADMSKLDYPDNYFDVIIDVFSGYCLDGERFGRFIKSVYRCLKPDGLFFSYYPSKNSDAFTNYLPAQKIDACTLSGIYRDDSPYSGNHYNFRFMYPKEYEQVILKNGMKLKYLETIGRTYRKMTEYFEHIVIVGQKILNFD